MTRRRYIQDPVTLELVPAEQFHSQRAEAKAPMVMPDIQPYRSMVTGELIGGRRQHREHLRQHNVVEVGNEFNTPKPKPVAPPPGLKEHVIRAAHRHMR